MRYLAALLLSAGCTSAVAPAPRPQLSPGPGDEINGTVQEAVKVELGSLVELYKWFHENAELSLKEEKTAAKFAAEVRAAGWTVTEKIGGHAGAAAAVVARPRRRDQRDRQGRREGRARLARRALQMVP